MELGETGRSFEVGAVPAAYVVKGGTEDENAGESDTEESSIFRITPMQKGTEYSEPSHNLSFEGLNLE